MAINKISESSKFSITKKSVRSLPNNPSEKGFKAEAIKKAMYEFVTGDKDSVMAEIDRVIDEANAELAKEDDKIYLHEQNQLNPHNVTKEQVGLGNVDNTSDENKPVSNPQRAEFEKKVSVSDIIDALNSTSATKPLSANQGRALKALIDALTTTVENKANDEDVKTALNKKIGTEQKGNANGVAELGDDGKVPISQLPMDVLEQIVELVDFSSTQPSVGAKDTQYYNTTQKKIYTSNGSAWVNPETPSASKIYSVVGGLEANKQYRWSGSDLVMTGSPLVLGDTSVNAFRGDWGKSAYEHSQKSGNPHGTTKGDIGLGNVDNTADKDKNVNSAQFLANARKINGVPFNGTEDINITDDSKIPAFANKLTPATKTKISYDEEGRVTGGSDLLDADIPTSIARKSQLDSEVAKKLDKNLGSSSAGKMLVVGSDGNVGTQDIPEGIAVLDDFTNKTESELKKSASSAYQVNKLKENVETKKVTLGNCIVYEEVDETTGEVAIVFDFPDGGESE